MKNETSQVSDYSGTWLVFGNKKSTFTICWLLHVPIDKKQPILTIFPFFKQ